MSKRPNRIDASHAQAQNREHEIHSHVPVVPTCANGPDDFPCNLCHLFGLARHANQETFATELGINRSTVSRLMNGQRRPNDRHLERIAKYAGLSNPKYLLIEHSEFRRLVAHKETRSDLALLSFRTTITSLWQCASIFAEYEGQYVVYYRRDEPDDEKNVIASLLSIERVTDEGISVRFYNPYQERAGEVTAFEYSGMLFPVSEFLYIIAEQAKNNYEILSLIIRSSPTPRVTALRGLIAGIGVKSGRSYIAARPIVAVRRKNRITDPISSPQQGVGIHTRDASTGECTTRTDGRGNHDLVGEQLTEPPLEQRCRSCSTCRRGR
jgi:transcriptional regulator with XRE-family HTH domain